MTRIEGEWLTGAATQRVFGLLIDGGHQVFVVGGCVRNALLDQPIADIDFATDARPEEIERLADKAGLRTVPTGVSHCTLTLIVEDQPFEVTTFRRDVETDGRHAKVAFSGSVEEDARRRDFTMNALYADQTGQLLDPVGGLADLEARRVVFVGQAEDRVREDILRILRFFRFHAWYGDPGAGLDPEGLAACAAFSGEIETLSAERTGAEMLKLLAAENPAPALSAMAHSGVLWATLPGAEARSLSVLIHLEGEHDVDPGPLRRLACLGGEDVADRLRLSRQDARNLQLVREETAATTGPGELGYRHGLQTATDILLLRGAAIEQPISARDLAQAEVGSKAVFPVKAADLMPDFTGPALGAELDRLEKRWIASQFLMDRDALLA